MNDYLNHNQIEYLLFHMDCVFELSKTIKESMVFLKERSEVEKHKNKIIFILSSKAFDQDTVKWSEGIPVLFPGEEEAQFYTKKHGNILFNDDLLKSAFYLLSGYQEYFSSSKDKFGRFPYSESVQYKLNVAGKPLVNYYFHEIIKGIQEYCRVNGLLFTEKKHFEPFGFVLSHDIDKIEKYTWGYIGYKIKELTGFVKPQYSWLKTLRLFALSLLGYLRLTRDSNPFWTFSYLRELNTKMGFKSTYFFLPRNEKHTDADYELEEKRLLDLYPILLDSGNEIGMHGTVASSLSMEHASVDKKELERILGKQLRSIRQHRLCYQLPVTTRIQEANGYNYDNTLGFAEQPGFRNSYCLPFHLYDFEQDRMFRQWQIPLNVMDISLFAYQKYDTFMAGQVIRELINEVSKFNGLFTLLWHNTHLDENEFRGIREFYESVLREIESLKGKSVTVSGAVDCIES